MQLFHLAKGMLFASTILTCSYLFAQTAPNTYAPSGSNSMNRGTVGTFNAMPVKPPTRSSISGNNPPVTDSGITSQVYDKLNQDKVLSKTGINVSTQKGVVTLMGTVDTQEEADHAIQIAKSITGVGMVKSNINVRLVPQ